MLTKLSLHNFRRHKDLVIDFTAGINVIRAMNEDGKSTVLEGIAYALFGTKALRTSLEQAVTWDEPINSLKAALTLNLGGDTYVFTRSKAGAEVTKNGAVFCTGQNEVSALAASLLGADANIAAKIMFANQGSIRGALDGGPKELSVLIEDLSDMNIFDEILEAAQEKLALGSPALIEERLKGAEATREAATQNLPAKPDEQAHTVAIQACRSTIDAAKASIPDLEKKAVASEAAWLEASTKYMSRVTLEANVADAEKALARAKEQVAALTTSASTVITDSRSALRQELAEAEDFSKRQTAYRFFTLLPTGERYEGSAVEFEAVSGLNANEKTEVDRDIVAVERKMTEVKGRRINHDKCDKCGQDVTHLAHVVQTNAEVDAELDVLRRRAAELNARSIVLNNDYTKFANIERFAKQYTQTLSKIGAYVTLAEETYPPVATWVGSIPNEGPDIEAIKRRLNKADEEIRAVEAAKAKFDLASEQQAQAAKALADLNEALTKHESPTATKFLSMTSVKDTDLQNLNIAKGEALIAEQEMMTLTSAYESASKLWSMAQSRIDDADKVIAECKKDLGSLGFNNALVKKLRAIRPIVANKVWNNVLASVSVMFSQMRGEPSVVSKETSGFKVNGQPVESLSGSTLDVLGVALRCALLRTFIPHCGLLVLDEPAQGCDQERTENLLGFLQSLGMTQTLLVTHESISESVADNIIEL